MPSMVVTWMTPAIQPTHCPTAIVSASVTSVMPATASPGVERRQR